MRLILLLLSIFASGNVVAWTTPDYAALLQAQKTRDAARESQQRERLVAARQQLATVRGRVSNVDTKFRSLQTELDALQKKQQERLDTLVSQRAAVTDLYTTARQSAGDLIAILRNTATGPTTPELEQQLSELAGSSRALNLDALGGLWEALHLTLNDTATQSRRELEVQIAPGELIQQQVTRIGTVLAVAGDRQVVFDRIANLHRALPPGNRELRRMTAALSQNNAVVAYIPYDAGLVSTPPADYLVQTLRESGPVGLLIMTLGGIGVVVLLVRALLVYRLLRAEKRASATSGAEKLRSQRDSHKGERSESLSGWLNATLRREERRAQWGHTLLSIIIAVAPLLGLLGTVTGMILTFHALRLYGSGDPILMADGIAQALSTTLLGLTVAIPLLMGQRWLLGQANAHIRRLDALALSLIAESASSQ